MILHPTPCVRAGQFHWHPHDHTFSAEASKLGWPIGWPPLGRVYDDACDEGFTIISERTGREVVVAIEEVDRHVDYAGGWRAITFVPAQRKLRGKFRVVVFND